MNKRIVVFYAFYVIGLVIAVRVVDAYQDKDVTAIKATKTIAVRSALQKKIDAFIRDGVQNKVNTRDYDVEEVIDKAKSLVGTPHIMGGYSSHGIDCSGLVRLAHARENVDLPRSSHDQARFGTIVLPGEKLKRGDIVFFHSTYKKASLVTHTGIYLGNNKFIHTSSKLGVTISRLNSAYYQKHYLFATRLNG